MCFRPQLCAKKNEVTLQKNYEDLLIYLQNEMCDVKEIFEIGESKIISLHTEIIKIKARKL